MQPGGIGSVHSCMIHGSDRQTATYTSAPVVRADGDICYQIDFLSFMPVGDQADVTNNLIIFFPDITGERHGYTLNGVGSPAQEGIILAGTPHLLEVTVS